MTSFYVYETEVKTEGGGGMREMKFRAWLGYEERMIEWEKLHLETSENGLFLWVGDDEEDNFGSASGESDFKLMQYTGLKDKNGVDIYEGDILKPRHSTSKGVYAVVWYNHGFKIEFKFRRKYMGGEYEDKNHLPIYSDSYEVIGNIYENPELLEVERI